MPLTLPIEMKGRRWIVGEEAGDVFRADDDFDGLTLTIELKTKEEAKEIAGLLLNFEPEAKQSP